MSLKTYPPVGDVDGPSSATDGHVAVFDGTTGKLIKDGGAPGGSQTPWTSDIDAAGYNLAGTNNITGNNVSGAFATTATAATTTTLTVNSKQLQEFTGTTTQTVKLPVVSTLPQVGYAFRIINNSTGVVTVQSSGSNTIQALAPGTSCWFIANALIGTGASVWTTGYYPRYDTNNKLTANAFLGGFQSIATDTGTTTLTVNSAQVTEFTGSTTENCVLPVVSTLTLGQSFGVINDSSGVVTVKSSGSNTVKAMAAGSSAIFTCIAITGTGAASWAVTYIPATAGITNGAGNNVIPKSDGTNIVASLLSDDGTNVTQSSGKFIGALAGFQTGALSGTFGNRIFSDNTFMYLCMPGGTSGKLGFFNSSGTLVGQVDALGNIMFSSNAAPADGSIAANQCFLWFDSTNGAGKLMIKAKTANGTVVTGSVTLT